MDPGVEDRALRYFEESAALGYGLAMVNLGHHYQTTGRSRATIGGRPPTTHGGRQCRSMQGKPASGMSEQQSRAGRSR